MHTECYACYIIHCIFDFYSFLNNFVMFTRIGDMFLAGKSIKSHTHSADLDVLWSDSSFLAVSIQFHSWNQCVIIAILCNKNVYTKKKGGFDPFFTFSLCENQSSKVSTKEMQVSHILHAIFCDDGTTFDEHKLSKMC